MQKYILILLLFSSPISGAFFGAFEADTGTPFTDAFLKDHWKFPAEVVFTCSKGMTRDSFERFCQQYHEFRYCLNWTYYGYCTTAELCSWIGLSEMFALEHNSRSFTQFLAEELICILLYPDLFKRDLLPRRDLIIPEKVLGIRFQCSDVLTRARSSHEWHDYSNANIQEPKALGSDEVVVQERYFLPPAVRIVSAITRKNDVVSAGTVWYKGVIVDDRGSIFCEYAIDFSSPQTRDSHTVNFEYSTSFTYDYDIIFNENYYYLKKFGKYSCRALSPHKTVGDLLLDNAFEYRERGYSLNALAIAIRYNACLKSEVTLAVSRGVLDFVRPILKGRFHEFESTVRRITWSSTFKQIERASGAFCAFAYAGLGLHKPHGMQQARVDFDAALVTDCVRFFHFLMRKS